MIDKINESNVGSSFEDFLAEEDILSEVSAVALKRVLGGFTKTYLVNLGIFRPVWIEVEAVNSDEAKDIACDKVFLHPEYSVDKERIEVKCL